MLENPVTDSLTQKNHYNRPLMKTDPGSVCVCGGGGGGVRNLPLFIEHPNFIKRKKTSLYMHANMLHFST